MNFSSINIQGNIISSEILDKIRSEEKYKFQQPEAFGLARTASLRDEIGMAWSIMRTHWQAYKKRLETLPKEDTGTSLTREKLILPLLNELGYEVAIQRAQQIGGKSYAISHGASNRDLFPIHVMGYNDHLDKRRDKSGPRLSPHALVQEYLNNTEHLYALVTNGRQFRLLRDATRLVRISYLEFDLERMFEEELYADFSMLYRVLHVSRMPEKVDMGAESVIEYYHQESMASGTRIREKLSEAVEDSIKILANGFLSHPKNESLVSLFENNQQNPDTYYMHQLRLIYRVLFLIVLEERKMVYPDNITEDQQRLRDIYYRYYSIERLRKLTENRVYVDADKYDLWESLKTTFLLFEEELYGIKLSIKPLGSGLFAPESLGTLKDLYLKNGDLMEVLKRLTTFVGKQGQLVRVNYSDLDVEEFGSVYEGLLEYDPVVEQIGAKWEFSFIAGKGRSSSGSHYTPEELVKPLIKHSLEYIIADKLKEPNPEKALLSITVCDVACGSGHILLSAARKIATELASLREGVEQPSPTYYRTALRDVIRYCIYGVDSNPLAVELTKVALWIEAHNPGEPLNFLDHHIKCGNAIVGLAHRNELDRGIASEAFKTLPGDDKTVAKIVRDKNTKELKERKAKEVQLKAEFEKTTTNSVQDAIAEYHIFNKLPETTPEEIKTKQKAYKKFIDGRSYTFLRAMADVKVAQFFIPKIRENQQRLMTDGEYRLILSGWQGWQDPKVAYATIVSNDKRFFHWFLEFPEVFKNGGFDCILGNPPFLGGGKISTNYGSAYLNYLFYEYPGAKGLADYVIYFFRRNFNILNNTGFLSCISTNTISQGDTRESSLDQIVKKDGKIIFAQKNVSWPGLAAVEITLISITKFLFKSEISLNGKKVDYINSHLEESDTSHQVFTLYRNRDKGFLGTAVQGGGFILDKVDADSISKQKDYSEVIQPYLTGDDINSTFHHLPSQYVINFKDWGIEKARKYHEPFRIVEDRVKPLRDKNNRKTYRDYWWHHGEKRLRLYQKLSHSTYVYVSSRLTKHLNFTLIENKEIVFSDALVVLCLDKKSLFSVLSSNIYTIWAWRNGSTMGTGTLRFGPTDCFENFAFPKGTNIILEQIGDKYNAFRNSLLNRMQLGLTKTYNAFHSKEIKTSILSENLEFLLNKEIEKKYGKEVWSLWNHLQKTESACNWEEAVNGIVELRLFHKKMDEAVLEAYGWHEDNEKWGKAIDLKHDFYEVDYLPENDRVRYTIHPESRKEVLKRLLLLNHERYEEEIMQGLHSKKDVLTFYEQKGTPVPEGIEYADGKKKRAIAKSSIKKKVVGREREENIQPSLFTTEKETTMREFGLQEGIYSIHDVSEIIGQKYYTVRRWFAKLAEVQYEGLDKAAKKDIEDRRINFHGLVELVVIGTLLDNNFKIKQIFKARNDLGKKTEKIYPFATNNVKEKLKIAGKSIIFEFPEGIVTLNGTGQYHLEFIREFFEDIEFDSSGIAKRLIPTKGHGKIVIDPSVGGGKPSFKNHKGVKVDTIMKFYVGPESISELEADYGLSKEEIEAAIEYTS